MIRLDLDATKAAQKARLLTSSLDISSKGKAQNVSISQASIICIVFDLRKSSQSCHILSRVAVSRPSCKKASSREAASTVEHQSPDNIRPNPTHLVKPTASIDCELILTEEIGEGIVGPVFKGTVGDGPNALPIVAKIALDPAEQSLLFTEASIYGLMTALQGNALPIVYGLFSCASFVTLVMQYRGRAIEEVEELTVYQRGVVFDHIQLIHEHGVIHGDLRPQNIVVSEAGGTCIIDFSHARWYPHRGPLHCRELADAREFLLLEDSGKPSRLFRNPLQVVKRVVLRHLCVWSH